MVEEEDEEVEEVGGGGRTVLKENPRTRLSAARPLIHLEPCQKTSLGPGPRR